jgi:DNA-binding MarR family transcriptional regulator
MTDLGNRLLIRPPSVTGVVDRLERAGLVERTGSPSDQRSKLVALTAAGRQLVRRAIAVHEKQVESVLAGLEPNEQAALNHYLVRLGQHLERLLDRGPAVVAD